MNERTRHVAIILGALSSYHLARVRAAGRRIAVAGGRLTVLQRVGYQSDYPWFGREKHDCVEVVDCFNSSRPAPRSFRSAIQLFQALRRHNPDVVAFGYPSLAYLGALLWCKLFRRKAVLLSDAKEDDRQRKWWKEKAKSLLVRRFDAALVAGQPQVEYAIKLGIPREKCFVGLDVVDNERYAYGAASARSRGRELREELVLPDHYFLTTARFIPEKNLRRAIGAYATYNHAQRGDSWKWVLCGDGPLRTEIERDLADADLLESVLLAGLIRPEEIPTYYGLASAFWLPSHKDTWGLVVNEAMASGLPVLVSKRCGCVRDLVRDGENGWIFDPFDVTDMVRVLERMQKTPEEERLRMGQTSSRIIADWGPERFAQGLAEAVSSCFGGEF